jgi:hypothetical protein
MFHQNPPLPISLAFRLLIVLLCVVAGGNAQSASTVEWVSLSARYNYHLEGLLTIGNFQTLGMNLRFFFTTNKLTCPPTIQDANKDTSEVVPIFSSTTVVVGGAPPGAAGSTSFRLTNGWLNDETDDINTQTTITAAEPNAVGGGCWFSEPDGSVVIAPCGTDRCFQFYVAVGQSLARWHLLLLTSCRLVAGPGLMNFPTATIRL